MLQKSALLSAVTSLWGFVFVVEMGVFTLLLGLFSNSPDDPPPPQFLRQYKWLLIYSYVISTTSLILVSNTDR